jgi:hypothetical protein
VPRVIIYRRHALVRMRQRQVDFDDIRRILDEGEVIERYPDDKPYPSHSSSDTSTDGRSMSLRRISTTMKWS